MFKNFNFRSYYISSSSIFLCYFLFFFILAKLIEKSRRILFVRIFKARKIIDCNKENNKEDQQNYLIGGKQNRKYLLAAEHSDGKASTQSDLF